MAGVTFFTDTFFAEEKQSIILVSNDAAFLGIVGCFIDSMGIPCRIAKNVMEAMDLMERQQATIVITDLFMSRMDGMALIRELKAGWPDVDIIVVTDSDKIFSYIDVINAGASDHIRIPCDIKELEGKLKRIIRERNLRATLRHFSIRDCLTGLYNRRFFEQKLEEEAERACRQRYIFFLIMVDIDNFKLVNDTFGHQEGDRILKNLAMIMLRSTRKYVDSVSRYGGDEFAIIIPQVKLEQVQLIAERIRCNYLETDRRGTTISIGISRFKRTQKKLRDDLYVLLHAADEAMYEAKERGGNRAVVHKSVMECPAY